MIMADLKTKYLNLTLENPIIAGASSLTSSVNTVKKLEQAGAAAVVLKSLFEEEIQYENFKMEDELSTFDDWHAEMGNIFPEIKHAGPREHLLFTKEVKQAVSIPVLASLNAVSRSVWSDYAKQLEEAGVDGLELNFYSMIQDPGVDPREVEKEHVSVVQEVKQAVSIPVGVKLSPFLTNPLNHIKELDKAGADGFVLFNRLFHPDFNIFREDNTYAPNLSGPEDHRTAVRFTGMLYDEIQGSLCASNGIHTAEHIIRALLAGADCVQMVSALFENSPDVIETVKAEIEKWMDGKGYNAISDFRGNLSKKNNPDKWTYSRAKYIKILQSSKDLMEKLSII